MIDNSDDIWNDIFEIERETRHDAKEPKETKPEYERKNAKKPTPNVVDT